MRLQIAVRRTLLVLLTLALSVPAAGPARAADPRADAWWKAGRAAAQRARDETGAKARAKNVILFVGDGMGIATVTAARILAGQRAGKPGEENRLSFETLPFTALSKTYNTDFQVPDSAGTMTAMTTGVKTRMGVLGVDDTVARGDFAATAAGSVPTILEQAEDRGLWTGVVTTTTVTHATPAGCYAHTPERNWEGDAKMPADAREAGFADIARQLVEQPHGDGPEVALGGGRAFFLPATVADPEHPDVKGTRLDGRDLTAEWRKKNPEGAWVWNLGQLEKADAKTTPKLLGLFDPGHMQFAADRAKGPAGEPTLAQMTAKALDVLQRAPKGFFLLVEGGRIDHGHHAGNAYRALDETIAFADAVTVALERTSPDDTLIVVTADHGHTLTISGYPKRGNPILGLAVGAIGEDKVSDTAVPDLTGRPYTTLGYANGPGYTGKSNAQPEGAKRFPHLPKTYDGITQGRPDLSTVDVASPDYLQESTVALGSETHGGEDVGIWARGPGAAAFHGTQEQNFVYHAMAQALGWE